MPIPAVDTLDPVSQCVGGRLDVDRSEMMWRRTQAVFRGVRNESLGIRLVEVPLGYLTCSIHYLTVIRRG